MLMQSAFHVVVHVIMHTACNGTATRDTHDSAAAVTERFYWFKFHQGTEYQVLV